MTGYARCDIGSVEMDSDVIFHDRFDRYLSIPFRPKDRSLVRYRSKLQNLILSEWKLLVLQCIDQS
ncbi:MAG: hypothetical protein V9G98_12955 [Candidatus Competibacter sp.]